MVNTRWIASTVQVGLALGVCLFGLAASARALSTSDKPAAILVWPKIVVDTSALLTGRCDDDSGTDTDHPCNKSSQCLAGAGTCLPTPTDTIIQIGNTDSRLLKQAHCFYVNANGHCGETAAQPGKVCLDATDCPLAGNPDQHANCDPGWTEIDFDVRVTPEQPLAWRASRGLRRNDFPLPDAGACSNNPSVSCNPNSSINTCGSGVCNPVASNAGSGIPPTPEDPFVGTLKCVQYDPTQNPPAPDQSGPGRLIGTASIEACDETCGNGVDVERYNAVGFLFKNLVIDHPGEVRLDNVQYEPCPSTLIMNHIFDNAPDPLSTAAAPDTVFTDLTLVPCGDDFLRQKPGNATAQFLVFNEFEQRLSTSKKVDCFFEKQLSLIDTGTSTRSIFSFNVQGSLAGQTRVRGVGTAATGHGLIGVARAAVGDAGVAFNLQQSGNLSGPDIITLP